MEATRYRFNIGSYRVKYKMALKLKPRDLETLMDPVPTYDHFYEIEGPNEFFGSFRIKRRGLVRDIAMLDDEARQYATNGLPNDDEIEIDVWEDVG